MNKKKTGMSDIKHDLSVRLVKLVLVAVVCLLFAVIWKNSYSQAMYRRAFYRRGYWVITGLFFLLYYAFGRAYEAFLVSINKVSEVIFSQGLALFLSDGAMYIVTWLLVRRFPSVWPMLGIFCLQMAVAAIWAFAANRWYFKVFSPRRTAIIYDMREGMEELIAEYGLEAKFRIALINSIEELLEKGVEVLDGCGAVFLCGVHSHERNIVLKYCIAQDIQTYVIPRIGDVLMSGARHMHMLHLPVLRVDRCKPTPEYALIKRLLDVVVSGIALVLLSPVFLVVAIAIKSDGGPVFYRQVRLTANGREFKVLKFRSMRVDAEKDGIARLSSGENDDRITPVGRIIRKFRLDELPQLINILKGDMSLVGPRPERPEIAAEYEKELPEFRLRLQVKAGLTGYAQVYGKYNTIPYDKLMMDLMYISHQGVFEDLRILLATVKILFMPDSTEGVGEGQTTALDDRKESDRPQKDAEKTFKKEQVMSEKGNEK